MDRDDGTSLPPVIPLEEHLHRLREETAAELADLDAKILRLKGLREPLPTDAPDVPDTAPVFDPPGILSRSQSGGERYSTSLLALDAILSPRASPTLVGLPVGRVVALNGAPGQGKSLLADQLAFAMACHGLRVVMLVDDEPREDAAERIGQALGFRHGELNAEYPGTIAAMAEKIAYRGLDISILPDEEVEGPRPTIEAAGDFLLSKPNEKGHVLVIDSLHSAVSAKEAEKDAPKTRIEARMVAIKHLRRRGCIVIFTAEANRSAYASKDAGQRSNPLASGAESRSIEFGSDLLLFLSPGPGDSTLVEVPKNRIGRVKTSFSVKLNHGAARFESFEVETAQAEAVSAAILDSKLFTAENAIVTLLEQIGEGLSQADILSSKIYRGRDVLTKALATGVSKGKFTVRKAVAGEGRGGGFMYELPKVVAK